MAELSRRTVSPPELGELLEFAERPRTDDWCLRAALTRYAQPEPARVGALLDLVRRMESTLDHHADEVKRNGPAIWAAVDGPRDATGTDPDVAGVDPSVVGVVRALREVDALGDVLCTWAVARATERPDAAVDATVAVLRDRLADLGVPEQERPGPPPAARRPRACAGSGMTVDQRRHPRRLRFAVELTEPFAGSDWLDSAREAEQLGYSTIFVPDHVDHGPGPLTVMGAMAAVTTSIKVGALVLDCDFRHPVLLAKELATLDVLSGGRLEVGLGAGWKATDYASSGITMDPPGVRVSRLQEHAAVLRGLWSGEPFSFAGAHYTVTDLVGTPAPARPGGPPILVGGGGPRLLRWAGAAADIVGVNASVHSGERDVAAAADALPERIDEKVGWLRDGAGDRFDELEINAWLAMVDLTDDPAVPEAIAGAFGVTVDELHSSPLALIGPAGAVAEKLEERRDRWGYSYHVVPGGIAREFAPVAAALTGT